MSIVKIMVFSIYFCYEAINKANMVDEIMIKLNVDSEKVLFFDDDIDNIENVRKIGIESICVGMRTGIIPYFKKINYI